MDIIELPKLGAIPLRTILPSCSVENSKLYSEPLNKAMQKYEINTLPRIGMFMAQLAHESLSLRYSSEIWGPTKQQQRYERNFLYAWPPTAQDDFNDKAYELGNVEQGDGSRFRGRGPIQTTGRTNYRIVGNELGYDFVANPDKLSLPGAGAFSSAFFWSRHGLNALADKGDMKSITKRINGGLNGFDERMKHWNRIRKVLGIRLEA